MNFVFPPQPQASAAIAKSAQRFPVNRIYCVGRNYAAHVREMGFDPNHEAPFFFQKPANAVVGSGSDIPFPMNAENLHHEIELVVAIGKDGRNIKVENALDHVWGYGVGVDLTRRDRQLEARDKGRPWDLGKAFDRSAPLGELTPASVSGHIDTGRIWLRVNGEIRQDADLKQLIWSAPEVIATLSESFELLPGDLIFTGTPEGVGPLRAGDRVEGGIDGLPTLNFRITEHGR
jgi:fumarylpyruvate hydrolase